MIKRCKFIVALALCLCIFAYDTVSISSDWGGGQLLGLIRAFTEKHLN